MSKIDELRTKAKQGDPEAMYELGRKYYEGDEVKKNRRYARLWWEKAAKKGDPKAMANSAAICAEEAEVEQDKKTARELWEKARYWWERAAAEGDIGAMYDLGVMYDEGDAVAPDKERARYWWQKAARKGHVRADLFLQLLDGGCLDKWPNLLARLSKLMKAIEAWKKERRYRNKSPTVYHYTRVEVLRSLLHERKLRLYNICYVNDPSEGTDLLEYSKKVEGSVLHRFFEQDSRKSPPLVYVGSFITDTDSKEGDGGDDLAMWRAYGQDGEGICLWIPSSVFNEPGEVFQTARAKMVRPGPAHRLAAVSESGRDGKWTQSSQVGGEDQSDQQALSSPAVRLALYRVAYSDEAKEKLIKNLNPSLSQIFKKFNPDKKQTASTNLAPDGQSDVDSHDDLDGDRCRDLVFDTVRSLLSDVLYLVKHKKYAHENEVRLISMHFPGHVESVHMDEERHRLYVETDEFLFDGPGYRVVVGPKRSPEQIMLEVEWRRRKEGIADEIEVVGSKVPYR